MCSRQVNTSYEETLILSADPTPNELSNYSTRYVSEDSSSFGVRDGILADVAPTLLFLLGLEKTAEMSGHNLLVARNAPSFAVSAQQPAGMQP